MVYQTKSILLVYYIVSWTGTLIFMLPEAQNLQISSTTVVIPGIFYFPGAFISIVLHLLS